MLWFLRRVYELHHVSSFIEAKSCGIDCIVGGSPLMIVSRDVREFARGMPFL